MTESIGAVLQAHIDNIMNLDRVPGFIDDLPLKQDEVQMLDSQIIQQCSEIKRCD